ncbi:hypothetical protein VULLAG_LOCUS3555 [Vulpes lagopus]
MGRRWRRSSPCCGQSRLRAARTRRQARGCGERRAPSLPRCHFLPRSLRFPFRPSVGAFCRPSPPPAGFGGCGRPAARGSHGLPERGTRRGRGAAGGGEARASGAGDGSSAAVSGGGPRRAEAGADRPRRG